MCALLVRIESELINHFPFLYTFFAFSFSFRSAYRERERDLSKLQRNQTPLCDGERHQTASTIVFCLPGFFLSFFLFCVYQKGYAASQFQPAAAAFDTCFYIERKRKVYREKSPEGTLPAVSQLLWHHIPITKLLVTRYLNLCKASGGLSLSTIGKSINSPPVFF